jgi:uroporphyrinogen decarboxylase
LKVKVMTADNPTLAAKAATMRFLAPFAGKPTNPPPVWLMRQAGRYLPEYRETRAKAGSFLNLCYTPAFACEVTMQPIRRFGFDASILFSDILVVPDAIGQPVRFVEGEGPRLDPLTGDADLAKLSISGARSKFETVAESVSRIRAALPKHTALIGFCGAPWTVATYMINGQGSTDQAATRLMAYRQPEFFARLIGLLVDASVTYLDLQIKAGADVVMIFDSWAGSLPDDEFARWVTAPTKRLVAELKAKHPHVPVIGFPRGAGVASIAYAKATGVQGIGCDTAMPLSLMAGALADAGIVVQGNLDPLLMIAGGDAMIRRAKEILDAMHGRRFVFNLGHGITPEAPPQHVADLMQVIRSHQPQ